MFVKTYLWSLIVGLAVVTIIIISLAAIIPCMVGSYINNKYPDSDPVLKEPKFYEIAEKAGMSHNQIRYHRTKYTITLANIRFVVLLLSIIAICACVLICINDIRGRGWHLFFGKIAVGMILICLANLYVTIKKIIKTKRL